MTFQKTRLEKLTRGFYENTFKDTFSNWKYSSVSILSLLCGFYLGSNVTAFFIASTSQRTIVAIIMTIIVEFLIRIRSSALLNTRRKAIISFDNIRIGAVFAVVLEAFKLGS